MTLHNKKLLYFAIILGIVNFLFININPKKNSIRDVKKTGLFDFDFAPNNFHFKLNIIRTKHCDNKLLYVAKNGEMKFRPHIFVGDPVLDFNYNKIGEIEEVSWEMARESIEIEFTTEKTIPIGEQIYIILNSNK